MADVFCYLLNMSNVIGIDLSEALRAKIPFLAAQSKHTGDNAGMIAFAAWADSTNPGRSEGMGLRVEPSAALASNPS